jgi:signal transduction histidine kinase
MGIGLFQSKMIVEAHHGRFEVESEEGKGATFRVLLPTYKK